MSRSTLGLAARRPEHRLEPPGHTELPERAHLTEGMLVLLIPVVKETQVTQKLIGERLHLPAGARIHPDSDHDRRYQLHPPAAKILSCPHPASVTGCALIWICATWWTML